MTTKTQLSRLHASRRVVNTSAGGVPTVSNSSVNYQFSQTFTGTENPQWKSQVKRGQNATTFASGSRETTSGWPMGSGSFRHTSGSSISFSGYLDGSPVRASSGEFDYSEVGTTARLEFIEKYREARIGFQSGTFLGELRQTLHMIKRPAQAFRNGLDNYYRTVTKRVGGIAKGGSDRYARKKRAKAVSDAVAGTWLEYAYGWDPLCRDIDDGMRTLAGLPQSDFRPIRSYGSKQLPTTNTKDLSGIGASIWFETIYGSFGSVSVRYIGAVRSSRSNHPTGWEQWGFTPSEIVPTIWELIPYSFLVDYFTNIGDILNASAFGTVNLAWGCKTSRGERRVYSPVTLVYSTSASQKGSGSGGSFSDSYTSFTRGPVTSIDVGVSDFGWKVPDFGSRKWFNVGSLFALKTFKGYR